MLKTAFGEQAMGRSQTFQWFSQFNAGITSTDDDERSGRPVFSSTPEMIERLRWIILVIRPGGNLIVFSRNV